MTAEPEFFDSIAFDEQFTGPDQCVFKFSCNRVCFIVLLQRPENQDEDIIEAKLFNLLEDFTKDNGEDDENERLIETFREEELLPSCRDMVQRLAPKDPDPHATTIPLPTNLRAGSSHHSRTPKS